LLSDYLDSNTHYAFAFSKQSTAISKFELFWYTIADSMSVATSEGHSGGKYTSFITHGAMPVFA
jgi:hypothetical protein